MRNFIGRNDSLAALNAIWGQKRSQILALYGRRRVGKSELIRQFCKGKAAFCFEAVEGEDTLAQIRHFLRQMAALFEESHLADLAYTDWPPVFDLLTQKLSGFQQVVVAFDELSWMAAGHTHLVSQIKYYWDQKWKFHKHLLLILCGSVASWMLKNVVRSKALYGRISRNMLLEPLSPREVAEYIGKKRGQKEVLEYLLCFGGIPRYLEEFDFDRSLEINIEKTCFNRSGFFAEEADKIFYNQFRETQTYRMIVAALLKEPLSLAGISQKIKMRSGGGLKQYLDNLRSAGIISEIRPIRPEMTVAKAPLYFASDEFLRFNNWFIAPNRHDFSELGRKGDFVKYTRERWPVFLGLAFEKFCLKHNRTIAEIMGFEDKTLGCSSFLKTGRGGYQFDLAYLRRDSVLTLCEIKYTAQPLGTAIIREIEDKIAKLSSVRGLTVEKVLITNHAPQPPVLESGYFHHVITARQIVDHRGGGF